MKNLLSVLSVLAVLATSVISFADDVAAAPAADATTTEAHTPAEMKAAEAAK